MIFSRTVLAIVVTLVLSATANAAVYNFATSSIDSWGELGDPNNAVFVIDLASEFGLAAGTPLVINGVGWDVRLSANDPSFLSDLSVGITNTAPPTSTEFDFIDLFPAEGSDFSGSDAFSSGGLIDLSLVGAGFPVILPDGIVVLEFYDFIDDLLAASDGAWDSGVLILDVNLVPLPAALPLFLFALGLLGLLPSKGRPGLHQ